ncbi:MAG: glycosyltransferase family 4 protein [Janthinobacterium lividum]
MLVKAPVQRGTAQKPMRVFMMDTWATVPYYTAYLAKALGANGISVQVGSMTYYLDPSCFRDRGLGLHPGAFDVVGRLKLPRVLRRILKLAEGVVNLCALGVRFFVRPPDVVHVQFLPMLRSRLPVDHWFVQFCQWRGIPVILTVHDLLPHDSGARHHAIYERLYARMDGLICHSTHIRKRLIDAFGISEEKVAVIPHGPFFFDLADGDSAATLAQLDVGPGQHMVLWQGILLPYKGVDLLLEAWGHVEQQAADLCLVILGTGEPGLVAQLQEQARALDLKNVRFHPRFCSSAELVAAYQAAEVVIYPYRAITTSGALATGLALGKALIASRLPVFEELLTDGVNAVLVDPEDVVAMARMIVDLIRDPVRRKSMEDAVRTMQFGEQTWRAIARDTVQVYEKAQRQAAETLSVAPEAN